MSQLIPIDIVGHADFGGRLRGTKMHPGYARFATAIDNLRQQNPEGFLLVDAGDEFTADYWGGRPVVDALALMDTDSFTLGNHEFDNGKDFLEDCISHAPFPILCANIHERETGLPIKGTQPWVIIEKASLKIGILGLTTEYTPYMVTAPQFAPFEVSSTIEAANQHIPVMREEGADIIVVVAHFPFYIEDNGTITGELQEVLTAIPPIDVFVGGHIPGDYADVYCDTVVLKGGFGQASIPHARLWYDPKLARVARKEATVHQTAVDAPEAEPYLSFARQHTAPFDAYLNEYLGQATETWHMTLAHESHLGNFLADCMAKAASTPIAYMNATSAGGTLHQGPVTVEDITLISGFNDPVYHGTMTGWQIRELFELVYTPERFGNNGCLLFTGLIVSLDHTKPSGHKVTSITLSDGTLLNPEGEYEVATSEYMANGGNDTSSIAKQIAWQAVGINFHDAIFSYIRENSPLHHSAAGAASAAEGAGAADSEYIGRRLIEIGEIEGDNSPF